MTIIVACVLAYFAFNGLLLYWSIKNELITNHSAGHDWVVLLVGFPIWMRIQFENLFK